MDTVGKARQILRFVFCFLFWGGGILTAIGMVLFKFVDVEILSFAIFSGLAYLLLGELEGKGD